MKEFNNILITGASSGLGAAIAAAYAKPGVQIFLSGRSVERLEKIAAECAKKGAKVVARSVDVTDKNAIADFIKTSDARAKLDLVIANAGISETTAINGIEKNNPVEKIFDTNINGVINTISPAIELMKVRKSGQIAIISSLAALRGIPSCPAYSASKGAVRFYGEALRGVLKEDGIGINVICPGYIKTPMTDVNDFPMPFLMSAEKAAEIIKQGIAKNKARVAFPKLFYWVIYLVSILPVCLTDPIFERLPRKKV